MNTPPPERLGPYRLEGRLGRGGMGEVYRAFDERLHRTVAVKLIRPEAAGDSRARERFRREARAAASLNHSAIVQIHDIVETPEGDAIVMELVAGQTLASLLSSGPLDLPRALRLGVEVAEGLAAAHARGLVHRDLKPENVMVTDAGHAKILDFGLAKRSFAEAGETSLSLDGTILGTYRSMSPEQARGLTVDGRSDLFSLGILLYEALTGESPFAAGTVLETLTHICTACQRPAAELRPTVPAALSALLDRLLEKDPARRPQSAEEVAAALAELAGWPPSSSRSSPWRSGITDPADNLPTLVEGRPLTRSAPTVVAPTRSTSALDPLPPPRWPRWRSFWALGLTVGMLLAVALGLLAWNRLHGAARERLYVAVLQPQVGRGADLAGMDLMASGLRVAVLRSLLAFDGISPLTPEQVDPIVGPPRTVARAVAAGEVVTSRLDCDPASCQVALSRVRGADGSLLWTQSFEAPLRDPYLLAEAVAGHLRQAYPERSLREGSPRLEVRAEDYPEYLRLVRGLQSQGEGLPIDQLLERVTAVRGSSPRFVDAYILDAAARRIRFASGRDPEDLKRAFDLLVGARALAPADPRPLSEMFEVALQAERLDRAEQALVELERYQPGDFRVLVMRSRLLERRGAAGQALDLMTEAARRHPSWTLLASLASMEYRLGRSASARRHVEESLALYPGQYGARSLLAQIELLSGSPERAAALYTELVKSRPRPSDLVNLAVAHLLLRQYPAAEERARQALALTPENPLYTLNLADTHLLAGHSAAAMALYRQVLTLTGKDPGAAGWQLLSARAQALAHLGERQQAVETAEQVLLAAHENSQALQEVALVYVLVGERYSALANAGKALARGVEPRWFDLPWYDPLRSSPEFQEILRRRSPSPAG